MWVLTGDLDARADGKHADGKAIISDGSTQVKVTLTGTREEKGHPKQTFQIVRTVRQLQRAEVKLFLSLDGHPVVKNSTELQKVLTCT
jgi:hypothetical protein